MTETWRINAGSMPRSVARAMQDSIDERGGNPFEELARQATLEAVWKLLHQWLTIPGSGVRLLNAGRNSDVRLLTTAVTPQG
jgi:hypothetical protein